MRRRIHERLPIPERGVFHADAREYGLLLSIMAIGTVAGALLTAGRGKPGFGLLLAGAGALAALPPSYRVLAIALVVIGVATLTFANTTNSLMQLSTEPAMRGRVMALRVGIALVPHQSGRQIVGRVANHFGPRWAPGIGAASGFAAAIVGVYAMMQERHRLEASAVGARSKCR
jgi:MFS family permease